MQNHQKVRAFALGIFMAGVIGFAAALPAEAQWNKPVKAKAGTATQIHSVGIFDRRYCNPRPLPKVTRMQAQNGAITTRAVSSTFAEGPCKGKKGQFLIFFHTPNPGFHGKDTAQINYVMPKAVSTPSRPNKQASGKRISITVE